MAIRYAIPIQIVASGTGNDLLLLAATNIGAAKKRTPYLVELRLVYTFAGTAVASTSRYDIERVTNTATPTGGTAIAAVGIRAIALTGDAAVGFDDIRAAAGGLTIGGSPTYAALASLGGTRQLNLAVPFHFCQPVEFPPGTGFAIRNRAAGVVGDTITGTAVFEQAG